MKTSNKLLLGVFLAVVLGIIGIYTSLYAKLQSTDFVKLNTTRFGEIFEQHDLPPAAKSIIVSGLSNLDIVASDTNRVVISKIAKATNRIFFYQQGDVLIIKGDTLYDKANPNDSRADRPVTLYVNTIDQVKIINAECYLYGNKDSGSSRSLNLELDNVDLNFRGSKDADKKTGYWSNLKIEGTEADIELAKSSNIRSLDVSLKQSKLRDKGVKLGKLSIQADDLSELSLKGESINKIISKQP
ncbi:MAG: hypothetical protein QM731_14080 [Chitinophagaceae bacterium]